MSWVSVLFNSDCDNCYCNSPPVITPQLRFYRQSNQQTLLLVRAKVPFITITIRDCGLWWHFLCNLTQILIDLHNSATTEARLYCLSQLLMFTEIASFNSFFRILFPTVPPQINLFFVNKLLSWNLFQSRWERKEAAENVLFLFVFDTLYKKILVRNYFQQLFFSQDYGDNFPIYCVWSTK